MNDCCCYGGGGDVGNEDDDGDHDDGDDDDEGDGDFDDIAWCLACDWLFSCFYVKPPLQDSASILVGMGKCKAALSTP